MSPVSSRRRDQLSQAWNSWWNPQSGTHWERLRAWRKEFWGEEGLVARYKRTAQRNASGARPRTEEERLRGLLFMHRFGTLAVLVIYGIVALYFLSPGGH
jgi:hypothetical protein